MYGRGMSRGMSFHRFPSKKDPVFRELCINITGQRNVNKNWMPSEKSRLCGDHFPSKGLNSKPTSKELTQPMLYQCCLCPAAFGLELDLKKHLGIAHPSLMHQCTDCPSSFSSEYALNTHKSLEHLLKAFVCDMCPSVLNSRDELTNHLLIVHNHVPYKCNQCSSVFSLENSLKQHMAIDHRHNELEDALKALAEVKQKLAISEKENEVVKGENTRLEMEIDNRDAFIAQEAIHVTAAEKLMHENKLSAEVLRQKCQMYREQLGKKRLNEHRLRMKLFRSKKFKNSHNLCLKKEKQIEKSRRIASAFKSAKSTFLEGTYQGEKLQIMKDILRPLGKNKKKLQRPKQYSKETQDFALSIHYRSPAAYNHLRSTFSLPSKSTIHKLLDSTDCTPGNVQLKSSISNVIIAHIYHQFSSNVPHQASHLTKFSKFQCDYCPCIYLLSPSISIQF